MRAIQDLAEGLTSWRLWTTFGYERIAPLVDTGRTLLGLVWISRFPSVRSRIVKIHRVPPGLPPFKKVRNDLTL